jgi:gamma-glutamyltranspeptidase / glutathione hydrolase
MSLRGSQTRTSVKRLLTTFLFVCLCVFAPASPLTNRAARFSVNVAAAPQTPRQPVRAARGMVASDSRIASEVGVSVLKRGGNAVDAAVAVALALAVVYPEAGNLGGGGFMLMRLGDGRTAAIDYREMAPAAAHRNLFLDAKGDLVQGEGSSRRRYPPSGVPGPVGGLGRAR